MLLNTLDKDLIALYSFFTRHSRSRVTFPEIMSSVIPPLLLIQEHELFKELVLNRRNDIKATLGANNGRRIVLCHPY